jgi:hypothetical protein
LAAIAIVAWGSRHGPGNILVRDARADVYWYKNAAGFRSPFNTLKKTILSISDIKINNVGIKLNLRSSKQDPAGLINNIEEQTETKGAAAKGRNVAWFGYQDGLDLNCNLALRGDGENTTIWCESKVQLKEWVKFLLNFDKPAPLGRFFPKDIPLYPGAQCKLHITKGAPLEMALYDFYTPDNGAFVSQALETGLQAQGWQQRPNGPDQDRSYQVFTSGKKECHIIFEEPSYGGTEFLVALFINSGSITN